MKKRKILLITILILLLINLIAFNVIQSSFNEDDAVYSWMKIAIIAFIIHTVYSLFMPQKYRFFKLIPSFFIVGFMVAFLTSYFPDPNLENPFGILSMIYVAILVTSLMYLVDLFSPSYRGFHIFVSVLLISLVVYGNINTFYYSSRLPHVIIGEAFFLQLLTTHIVFFAPFWIMMFIFIYHLDVTPEYHRTKEVMPYNRYRPLEIDPAKKNSSNTPKIVAEVKTPEQLNRERNAIKSLTVLKDAGLLSTEEFERKKNKILNGK